LPAISRVQASGENGAFEVSPDVESRISQMQGGGQAIPEGERAFFETRMGYDFSKVRVHTDSNAVQTSRALSARAFTTGNDIAFGAGTYQPGTNAGRRLLAHELTHVVQQTGGVQTKRSSSAPKKDKSEHQPQLEQGKMSTGQESGLHVQTATITPTGDEENITNTIQVKGQHVQTATITPTGDEEDITNTIQKSDSGVSNLIQRVNEHCVPTGSFTSIPSGTLTAAFGGGKFGASFRMEGEYVDPIPCIGNRGEYRQRVKGFFKHNGSDLVHALCSNTLSRTTWYEDCASIGGTDHKYGYRSIPFATSKFEDPDQATGCKFKGYDYPGFSVSSLSSGDTLEVNLDFEGKLVDAGNGDAELASSTWSVVGSGTVP
jgi:hypothetical protein